MKNKPSVTLPQETFNQLLEAAVTGATYAAAVAIKDGDAEAKEESLNIARAIDKAKQEAKSKS